MSETETEAPAPTCYRHDGRETYVRCTRCDRPICPDCMNEAAVGFQCPECVREGNKTVRQARTVFGGRAMSTANVTRVLIGLNVCMFVGQQVSKPFTDRFAMNGVAVAVGGEYYRMLTATFLHDPSFLFHIGFNMYALFMFGSQVERLVGTLRYVVLYLVAAFGASVASYWFLAPGRGSIGASGAVFGLFGAYFVMARKLRADTSQLVFLIGINLVIGFSLQGYIDNYAHIGGLVTGAVIAFVYTRVPRGPRQTATQLGLAAAVVVALVVATMVRTEDIRQGPIPLSSARVAATSGTGAPSR
jgi:membrane associated rhomboid family serine protease